MAAAWLPDFLARIRLREPPQVDVQGLQTLTRAFRFRVPFENLDVLAGVAVSTEPEAVIDKIVHRRRGGWCFELNTAFGELLKAVGFEVEPLLARVGYRRPTLGPPAHLLLRVRGLAGSWLVDVGFGAVGPGAPLPDTTGEFVAADGLGYRLQANASGQRSLARRIDGEWVLLYQIEPFVARSCDVEFGSHVMATWPASPFRRQLICSRDDGIRSWSIEGLSCVERDAQWRELARVPIADSRQLRRELITKLNLDVPPPLLESVWAVAEDSSSATSTAASRA